MKAHLRIFGTALAGVFVFLQYYQKGISPLDALAEFTVRGEKCTAKHSAPRVIGPSLPGGGGPA